MLSSLSTSDQPRTLKCARVRCKTCPFIHNVEIISGPKRSIKITDHFTCTSANVIYCITCTLCKKLYIGETERQIGDRFRERLGDVEEDGKNTSKPEVTIVFPQVRLTPSRVAPTESRFTPTKSHFSPTQSCQFRPDQKLVRPSFFIGLSLESSKWLT